MNQSATGYDISNWDNAVASVMMFVMFFNVTIIYNFVKYNNQRTSFNFICTIRALNNTFILLVNFIGVFLPATVLGYSIHNPMVETVIITTALNCNIYNNHQSIYMAVNRFVAIYFPVKYDIFFGMKATVLVHIIFYLDRIRNVTFENIERYEKQNFLVFNVEWLAYGGLIDSQDIIFYFAIGLTLIPFVINIFTFLKFYYLKKRVTRDDSERVKQARRNMRQFVQTVFQDSMYPISVVFNSKLNVLIRHRFWTFFCQTFIWQTLHVLDGLIMGVFNDRIAFLKKYMKRKIHNLSASKEVTPPPVVGVQVAQSGVAGSSN
ncbi:hypothetical protein GCK72_019295 [Caenorhabditis remanei]|uniref:7TM GPCR serpentine receptor class x (Srx) domain-containing protein n=1 Tax=Caenorhabditis remanei TaxID=31234 RepID=A0A6A5GCB6_CAERE|nr:hypothetical protein GCK72_019295 [Caenorhabditis remanei]KAF1752740.1 hypothetical protein GCK72_019295 [Caenorhabditis remanei]